MNLAKLIYVNGIDSIHFRFVDFFFHQIRVYRFRSSVFSMAFICLPYDSDPVRLEQNLAIRNILIKGIPRS